MLLGPLVLGMDSYNLSVGELLLIFFICLWLKRIEGNNIFEKRWR